MISLQKLFGNRIHKTGNTLLNVVNKKLGSEIISFSFSFSLIDQRPNEACRGRSFIFYESVARKDLFCDALRTAAAASYDAICIFGVVNTSVSRIASVPARISGPVYKSVIQHAIKCSTRWKGGGRRAGVGEEPQEKRGPQS